MASNSHSCASISWMIDPPVLDLYQLVGRAKYVKVPSIHLKNGN
jgi:hypothetical protein